jgi:hypothetical protein
MSTLIARDQWRDTLALALRVLFLIALFAACARTFGVAVTLMLLVFIGALIRLPMMLWQGAIRPMLFGITCPAYGNSGFRQVAAISFGNRFYQCADCKARFKRRDFESPWEDASSREDVELCNTKAEPTRRRYGTINALKFVGWFLGFVACATVGGFVAGARGAGMACACAMGLFLAREQHWFKEPTSPGAELWDGEIDA